MREGERGISMYHRQLKTFLLAADCGSFNRAAELSYVTPTAVIKQINLLESSLGTRLFERSHRGLILTSAGRSFYDDAAYMMRYWEDSVLRARSAACADGRLIRIGTSPLTPAQVFSPLWTEIAQVHPAFRLRFVPFENTPENAREILLHLGRNIDIVPALFDDTLCAVRHCHGYELVRAPICCGVPVRHPLARKDALDVSDLYGECLMLMHRGWSAHVDALRDDLTTHHPEIRIEDFHFYSLDAFNRCAHEGKLLMTVGSWRDVHPLVKVLPVAWRHTFPCGLMYAMKPTGVVTDFLKAVRRLVRAQKFLFQP